MNLLIYCGFLWSLGLASALHLPNYIKACKRTDPNLNQCARDSANKAIPSIAKGNKQFKTPSLSPLNLPQIKIQPSQNLNLVLTNCILYGLDHMTVQDMKVDLQKRRISVLVTSNHIELLAKYKINGQILVLPINGEGPMNITIVDSTFDYTIDYDLTKNKDGIEYLVIKNPAIKYDLKESYYHFDNLFNGNEQLGNEMNKFLNENSKEVDKDLAPTVSETINQIVTSIIKVIEKVPFDEIFLP